MAKDKTGQPNGPAGGSGYWVFLPSRTVVTNGAFDPAQTCHPPREGLATTGSAICSYRENTHAAPPYAPSWYCGHSAGIPLVVSNERDLNENDRAHRGDRREDMFAEAIMPKFVHGHAETDEYKAPDIESELN
jgi:hypothetical protein